MKILITLLLVTFLAGCEVTRSNYSDPLLKVTPNAYGLGVGSDQYGRPVRYTR